MTASTNLWAAWIGILAGMLSGGLMGLRFFDESWLGGYQSWRRRMVRLAHIAFFGIAIINLAYAVSVKHLAAAGEAGWTSVLLISGAITMPAVCYLAAWRKPLRHLFAVPVVSLLAGTLIFILEEVSL
jgi:hypothetical protein